MSDSAAPIPIEEQFRVIADTAPVMIWISAPDKLCYFFNHGWLAFTGRTMAEEIGSGWTQGVHPDDLDRCLEIYTSAFDMRKEFRMEYRLRRHDGTYRWLLDNGVPRYTSDGTFAGYIGSCIDIHDMVEAEGYKEEFISAASRELKTPITTMQVYIEMLEQMLSGSPQEEYIRKVRNQIKKLTNLINVLLDLAKMDAGKVFLDRQRCNFREVLVENIENIQDMFPKHSIQQSGSCDVEVWLDREQISQVLFNLLDNARKFSPKAYKIFVHCNCDDEQVIVSVEDFGVGIPDEHLDKIFNKFYRVIGEDKKTYPGLGIGLFLSSEIIKRHNGHIWAEKGKSGGTRISFSIPRNNSI